MTDEIPNSPTETAITPVASVPITGSSGAPIAVAGTIPNVQNANVPVVTAQNPKGALVVLTEGTREHYIFKQEFHDFLTSVKRDTSEIIAWLRARL